MKSLTKVATVPGDSGRTQRGNANNTSTDPTPRLFVLLGSSVSDPASRGRAQGSGLPASQPTDQAIRTNGRTDNLAITDTHTAPGLANRKHKWDPHRRYWSDAHSFPDYGSPALGGIMMKKLKDGLGVVFPINTLTGRGKLESNGQQNGTLKRPQEAPTPLNPKRPRTEQHTSPSRSIGGDSDVVEVVRRADVPRSAKEVRNTLSTQSNGDRRDDRDVAEFRQTQTFAGLRTKPKRQRNKRLQHTMEGSTRIPDSGLGDASSETTKTGKNEVNSDPIEDDVELIRKPTSRNGKSTSAPISDSNYTNSMFTLDSVDDNDEIASEEPASKPSQAGSVGQKHLHKHAKVHGKHAASTSEDELQAIDDQRPAKRRMGATDESSGLSTRGNIPKTHYAVRAGKNDFGDKLLVKRAVAVPEWTYPTATGTEEHAYSTICMLVVDALSPDCMNAVDPSGKKVAELEWLKISLEKVNSIFHCPEGPIIKIIRSVSVRESGTTGALLLIEFGSAEEAAKCVKWARYRAPANVNVTELPDDKLRCTLEKKFEEVSDYQPTSQRPGRNTGEVADDVKLLEHRELTKSSPFTRDHRRTLRSRMQETESYTPSHDLVTSDLSYSRTSRLRPSTRSSVAPRKEPSPKLETWTEKNPDWAANWKVPLIYQRTTVDKDDIIRLDEGQFMNDSLISFYLKYLHHQLEQKDKYLADKVYIFNSFFYEKLKPKGRGINYDGVKNWTTRVDLFSFDYIIVPVNEASHWWVTIICNPGQLLPSQKPEKDSDSDVVAVDCKGDGNTEPDITQRSNKSPSSISPLTQDISHVTIDSSDEKDKAAKEQELVMDEKTGDGANTVEQKTSDSATRPHKSSKGGKKRGPPPPRKYDPQDPRILTLDSLGGSHPSVVRSLKEYLIAEAHEKRGCEMGNPGQLGTTVKDIPLQDNFTDCGVYLLGYIREFMKDPDRFVSDILQREDRSWELNASELRNDLRKLILDLQQEYQAQEEEKRRARALQKRSKERSKEQSEPRSNAETPRDQAKSQTTSQRPSATPASAAASRAPSRHASPKEPQGTDRKSAQETSRHTSPLSRKETPEQNKDVKPASSRSRFGRSEKEQSPNKLPVTELHDTADIRQSIEDPSGDAEDGYRQFNSPRHVKAKFEIIPESPPTEKLLSPLSSTPTPPASHRKLGSREESSPKKHSADRAGAKSSSSFMDSRFGNAKVTNSRLFSDGGDHEKETIDLTT